MSLTESRIERFSELLVNESKNQWGKRLGLSNGTVSRCWEAQTPSGKTLSVLSYVDRVNPHWLLTGKGQKYLVTTRKRDVDLASAIADAYAEEEWRMMRLTHAGDTVIILGRREPAEKGTHEHTILEVFHGNYGPATHALLREHSPLLTAEIPADAFHDLILGEMSNGAIMDHLTQGEDTDVNEQPEGFEDELDNALSSLSPEAQTALAAFLQASRG